MKGEILTKAEASRRRIVRELSREQRDAFVAYVDHMDPRAWDDADRLEALLVTWAFHRDPGGYPR